MKTNYLFIPLLLITCSLCILSCSKEAQVEVETALTAEDEVLYQNAMLEGTSFRKQTVTRILLDATLQQITGEAHDEISCGAQGSVENLQITQYRQKDMQYVNRLRSIFKRMDGENAEQRFDAISCPNQLSERDEAPSYCQWEEELLMPILVNTRLWSVQDIALVDHQTQEVLASSAPIEGPSAIETFAESDFVLHRLVKVNNTPIPSGTVVELVVNRIQSNGLETQHQLLLEIK